MSDLQKKESRAKWLWAGIIVALLGGHMTIMIFAAYLALSDRSHAVMPNYYEKAVKWDQTKAERKASKELGWKVTYNFTDPDITGQRNMTVSVIDKDSNPIDNIIGDVQFFSHKQAGRQFAAAFQSNQPVSVQLRESGLWTFNLRSSATIGNQNQTFVDEQQLHVKDWRSGKIKRF
ncbi:FixH family protein [Planctomycetota bacterium]|nr:FixH family protein [Planctomycetota bacterium]